MLRPWSVPVHPGAPSDGGDKEYGLCEWKKYCLQHCKQRLLQPSSHHITAACDSEPWGNSGLKQHAGHQAVSHRSHLQWCTLRRLRVRKHRILAPDSWGAYQRNDFSEPRLLHLPIHRKALNSLTWDVWLSLLNSNLLLFWRPGLCCKNSYVS